VFISGPTCSRVRALIARQNSTQSASESNDENDEPSSEDYGNPYFDDFHANHIQATPTQKFALAAGSALVTLLNPARPGRNYFIKPRNYHGYLDVRRCVGSVWGNFGRVGAAENARENVV
jgi:hypothetical protein